MKALGKLGTHTLLILTPDESRLIREVLELEAEMRETAASRPAEALAAFRRGIARATERLQGEFDELQQTKKWGGK